MVKRHLPGLLLCVGLAALGLWLAESPFVKDTLHFGPLLLVILLAMVAAAFVPASDALEPGEAEFGLLDVQLERTAGREMDHAGFRHDNPNFLDALGRIGEIL